MKSWRGKRLRALMSEKKRRRRRRRGALQCTWRRDERAPAAMEMDLLEVMEQVNIVLA